MSWNTRIAEGVRDFFADPTNFPAPKPGATPLENHARFFDGNGDGVVTIKEAKKGLQLLGLDPISAAVVALPAAAGLTAATHATKNSTRIDNIAQGKGKASTWVFDAQGNFDRQRFDTIFGAYAGAKDYLDQDDVDQIAVDRSAPDTKERFRALLQFNFLLALAGEIDAATGKKILTRERMASFYSGTLFYAIAQDHVDGHAAATPASSALPVMEHILANMRRTK